MTIIKLDLNEIAAISGGHHHNHNCPTKCYQEFIRSVSITSIVKERMKAMTTNFVKFTFASTAAAVSLAGFGYLGKNMCGKSISNVDIGITVLSTLGAKHAFDYFYNWSK